jgi:signal transduction histidine kinase
MFTPVFVLAAIGIYYLRSDRILAWQSIAQESREYVDDCIAALELPKVLAPELKFSNGRLSGLATDIVPEAVFLRDPDGVILFPSAITPDNLAGILTIPADLESSWRKAEQAEFGGEKHAAQKIYGEISRSADQATADHARFRLGLLLLKSGEPEAADGIFTELVNTTKAANPLCRRSHWHLVDAFMTKRRTLYHPLTNVVIQACNDWVGHPNDEARLMLQRLAVKSAEMRHNILTPLVMDAMSRLARDDRARKLSKSTQIPNFEGPPNKLAYSFDSFDPKYVLRRLIYRDDGELPHELLVVWTPTQIAEQLREVMFNGPIQTVRRPHYIDGIHVKFDGHRLGGVAWDNQRLISVMNTEAAVPNTVSAQSNKIGGFDVGASIVAGTALSASNRRIVWLGLLILGSAGISVLAWRHTRRSVLRLADLNRQKSNFVSSVSHELRAPVASMQLMTESLSSGKIQSPEKRDEYYDLILHECRRLGALVHNVLDYARIEQRRKEYEFSNCDVQRLVENSVKLMEPAAVERGIQLRSETTPLDAVVDGEALQQALINLIDNGIKFAPTDSELLVHMSGSENARLELSVADQGPGIPPEQHERVFERFYRQEDELRRETTGVGIGLSIVKHIVDAHGGRVTIADVAPTGARFIIDIPLDSGGETT